MASRDLTKRKSGHNNETTSVSPRNARKLKKTNKLAEKTAVQNKQRNQIMAVVVIYVLIGLAVLYFYGVPTSKNIPPEIADQIIEAGPIEAKKVQRPSDNLEDTEVKEASDKKSTAAFGMGAEAGDPLAGFQPHVQDSLKMKDLSSKKKWRKIKIPKNAKKTSVKVYVMDEFLSPNECDGLIRAHSNHHASYNSENPLLCFSDEESLKKHLEEYNFSQLSRRLNAEDFSPGTKCLNASMSSAIKSRFRWSASTSFYPGESKFSSFYERKVQEFTGLDARNGGKFQVTSYAKGAGYKGHTDCAVGNPDGRDRYATILVYLTDVEEGGNTVFPELGITIKPRKGRALVWNNMDPTGKCDPLSHHKAEAVVKGKKVILQRWYYYQNFPTLGKRYTEPTLPSRGTKTGRISCDEFEFGSCRWYDEWTFDHLTSYSQVKHSLL